MNALLEKNKYWIDETWEKVEKKLERTSVQARDKLPLWTVDGVYDDHSKGTAEAWTNGFWPGIMWLMYAATGKECYKITAEVGEKSLDKALKNYDCLHHDVGFMWHISAGANHLLTGNEESRNRNLHAAATLATRFNLAGQFIKAWNGEGVEGWVIIDSLMNIPMLYWAAEQTNNIAFKQIAMQHADTTIKNHIREDGSVYHILNYDIHTGECLGPATHTQGYEPVHSSWSRGQAWAIYGFVLSYIHTGEQRYLDAAKRVAHYFIANVVTTDYIPLCDFRAPEEPFCIDSSAGAIAACGLIEIAKAVPEFEKKMYMDAAMKMVKALVDTQCDWSDEEQAILLNSSGSWNLNTQKTYIWGDYYFVEALYKLKGYGKLFW